MIVVALERMHLRDRRRRALDPAPRQRRQPRRRSLYRRTLQVMKYAAKPAELLTAAGAPRTAVHEIGQRRTMPGGLLRTIAVHDQDSAVIGRNAEDDSLGHRSVIGKQRCDQTALAAPDQLDGLIEIVVGHDRRNRAERLGIVNALCVHRMDRAQ